MQSIIDSIAGLISLERKDTSTFSSAIKNGHSEIMQRVGIRAGLRGLEFVRIAGLSGAFGVALGAYGAHALKDESDLKRIFETANRYHMMHSIALLGVPLTNKPYLVGTLMVLGMALFSGSCYYHALTGNTQFRRITPYGGMLLIAAWLAMIL